MLVCHVAPHHMRWQSRLFNDFDYLNTEPTDYIKDSDVLNRMIVVEAGIEHGLKNNVFSIIREADFSSAAVAAASVKRPIVVLSGDPDEYLKQFLASNLEDLGVDINSFSVAKRGNNELEQKMFARFGFIAKHKREIIDSGKRVWLLGFTQPHEVKRYSKEIYACVEDVIVREAFWRSTLRDEYYTALHDSYPEDQVVPLGVYESIRKFNDWART